MNNICTSNSSLWPSRYSMVMASKRPQA